jgi:REP element-mobilizing transposase RayT
MPRLARKSIETSYLHVMVQGIKKEFIFENKKYLMYYLQLIKENIQTDLFELLAYCMMNNHAHFLFFVNDICAFEKYMHFVNQKFAQKYNLENERVGVVFRNRYKVEPIYDTAYVSNCIKYIHENPVKARNG